MKKYILLVATLFFFCSFLQNSNLNSFIIPDNETISLVFAGDIMGHSPQYKAAYDYQTNSYNYDICFKFVKSSIENADFAIANLEVPIAGIPYSGYPNFSSPDALLDALKNTGFDVLLIANNHVLDRNKPGLERTIQQIKRRNLLFAGSYVDKNQRDSIYPLILESRGIKIAILNCTYGTNNINVEKPTLVNYIDSVQIINDIQKANELGANFKIMTIHWGTEYELRANETQRKLAQFFVKQGINLIVGSHPHVVQNVEFFYGKDSIPVPVFYSLGNFMSNQRKPNTDGGIILRVDIGKKSGLIVKTSVLPVYVYKGEFNKFFQFYLIPTTDYLSHPENFEISTINRSALLYFDKTTRMRLHNVMFH